MGVVLFRVDERLIHGQVVIGWGSELRPRRYLVIDDALAVSDWEQELYRLALTDGSIAEFASVDEARERLPEWQADEARSILLVRDIETALRLARDGVLAGEKVNLGGIHHAPGRTQVRSYLYLDDADRERIRELDREGVTVSARDLPDSLRVDLDTLLKE